MQRHAAAGGQQLHNGRASGPAMRGRLASPSPSSVIAAAGAREPSASPAPLAEDPEARFRRYGKDFGSRYSLNEPMKWLAEAPRVRIRSMEDRKLEELLELAVLNERLAGAPSWEVRQRLEYLKLRRRNWEAIYHYVTQTDAVATLALIEEANRRVEEALADETQQRMGVAQLQAQLLVLQSEVEKAAEKLQVTQQRVEQNLQRVNDLKAEAATLERMRLASVTQEAAAGTDTLCPASAAAPTSTAQAQQQAATTSYVEQQVIAPPRTRTTTTAPEAPAVPATRPTRRASPAQQQQQQRRPQAGNRGKTNSGLQSSLELETPLKQFWHPVAFTKMLVKDTMIPFELFNEPWVLFRDAQGKPSCIRDSCAHRSCPLSLGKVEKGQVSCAYHGWKFDGQGHCTEMPSTAYCRKVSVASLPCAEKDGFVWVWPGEGEPPAEVPSFTAPPPGFDIHAEIVVEVPCEHGLLIENLLDLAHAPFTHQGTFARGWPVPDAVRFHATQLLSGRWDPYPINMSFQPPCATVSMIGLDRPGKVNRGAKADDCKNHLHQLHVCMPARRGHTRLLYRMSMDFMGWVRHVPGIQQLWKKVAGQVLGEDLVLVVGQQDRLSRGDDTWANPMAYDKLAVRYRRWRNTVAAGDVEEGARLAAQARMNAGQMFSEMEEEDWGREAVSGDAKVLDADEAPPTPLDHSMVQASSSRAAGSQQH